MEIDSGTEFLSIKDIARRIARRDSDAEFDKAMRQVRHWTQHDLLKPFTPKNTGTGIARLYEKDPTLEFAAIFGELVRYGIGVDVLKPISEALYEEWDDYRLPFLVAETEGDSYLQVSLKEDPETGKLVGAEINFFLKDSAGEEGVIDPDPDSSIVINLSRLTDRLYRP